MNDNSNMSHISPMIEQVSDVRYLHIALETLRNINRLIEAERDTDRLIQGVCDRLTADKAFDSSCIVLLDEEETRLASAHSKADDLYPRMIDRIDRNQVCNCFRRALSTSEFIIIDDVHPCGEDCLFGISGPHHNILLYRLEYAGRVYGIINVTASGISSEDQHAILQDVTEGLSFALNNIEIEKEREWAEKRLQRNLKEKTLLLKEIHHRVKNNLQIISSLIYLQSLHLDDEKSIQIFNECLNRVRSMALIHEELYSSNDFSKIEFHGYIDRLVREIFKTYAYDASRVSLKLDVHDLPLSIEQAIPCGLIINELISNAIKYAFPNTFEGKAEIAISMRKFNNEEIELIVKDNGIGIPKNSDLNSSPSCGLEITNVLVEEQLEGSIHMDIRQGTKYTIRFKTPVV